MRGHIADGTARALLPGHFPVPVELDGRWWHVPDEVPDETADEVFVPADGVQARLFAALARRQAAAEHAVAEHDAGPGGPR